MVSLIGVGMRNWIFQKVKNRYETLKSQLSITKSRKNDYRRKQTATGVPTPINRPRRATEPDWDSVNWARYAGNDIDPQTSEVKYFSSDEIRDVVTKGYEETFDGADDWEIE